MSFEQIARWMMFVDGENSLSGAQKSIEELKLVANAFYYPDSFVWIPRKGSIRPPLLGLQGEFYGNSVRSFYYATAMQNEIPKVRDALWRIEFQPSVFPRKLRKDSADPEGKRVVSKGVDISLATDLLSNAFNNNFDIALLFAGDADYIPLVEQVKRLGKRLLIVSFSSRLSDDLRLSSDRTYVIDDVFVDQWKIYLASLPKSQ
jgi:uncharacterized LabA/DUF88 family protein